MPCTFLNSCLLDHLKLERQADDFKTKVEGLRRAKAATTVLKHEKEYVNASGAGFVHSIRTFLSSMFVCRTGRVEKVKCDKCEELEGTLDAEKKSNVQLKKQLEQKDNSKKQTVATTASAAPCPKCPTAQELLDAQKEENVEVMDRVMSQEKKTQEERTAKEVRAFEDSPSEACLFSSRSNER